MTRDKFIEGLRTLNEPNQGMRYQGPGFDHDGPQYDAYTGAPLLARYRSAKLEVHSDRAQFLYSLIQGSGELLAELTGGVGTDPADQAPEASQDEASARHNVPNQAPPSAAPLPPLQKAEEHG